MIMSQDLSLISWVDFRIQEQLELWAQWHLELWIRQKFGALGSKHLEFWVPKHLKPVLHFAVRWVPPVHLVYHLSALVYRQERFAWTLESFSGLHNQASLLRTVYGFGSNLVESLSLYSCTRTWSLESTSEYVAPLNRFCSSVHCLGHASLVLHVHHWALEAWYAFCGQRAIQLGLPGLLGVTNLCMLWGKCYISLPAFLLRMANLEPFEHQTVLMLHLVICLGPLRCDVWCPAVPRILQILPLWTAVYYLISDSLVGRVEHFL